MQRAAFGLAALVALSFACKGDDAGASDDGGTDGTDGTAGDAESTDTGDTGGTTGEADCSIPSHDDDVVVEIGDAEPVPGTAIAIAVSGAAKLACGQGFVAGTAGSTVDVQGTCLGVATDGTVAVATSDAGEIVLLTVDATGALTEVDRAQHMGVYRGVAIGGDEAFVAAGAAGVHALPLGGGVLGMPAVFASSDAHDVAVTDAGLLVADGDAGVKLLDPTDGTEVAELSTGAPALRIVGGTDRALVLQGPRDAVIVEYSGGVLSMGLSVAHDGVALGGAWLGDDTVLLSTASSLARFDLSGSEATLLSREPRPGHGQADGGWLGPMAGGPDDIVLAVGAELAPVTVDDPTDAPIIRVKEATLQTWTPADEQTEVVFLLNNDAATDLILSDFAVEDGSAQAITLDRPGCPGQYLVPSDRTLAVSLFFTPADDMATVRLFTATTNDPSRKTFELRVELNRPEPAAGFDLPDVPVPLSDGTLVTRADLDGDVVLFKLFNKL